MSDDTPTSSDAPAPADAGAPDRPPPPPPARAGRPAPAEAPVPVRTLMGGTGAAPAPPVELTVDGTAWWVRVAGRGRVGRSGAGTSLLLLGFYRDVEATEPDREALVPARALDELTELQLEAALRGSQPPPPAGVRKPLFPETGSRTGKHDG